MNLELLTNEHFATREIYKEYSAQKEAIRSKYRGLWRPATYQDALEIAGLCLISGIIVLPLIAGVHYKWEMRQARLEKDAKLQAYDTQIVREFEHTDTYFSHDR